MKALSQSVNKRESTITLQLVTPRSAYTVETFHTLRVELKKLKALFDLIEFCLPEFKRKKKFKPFKNIFEKAGKVRELQIADHLLHSSFTKKPLSKSRQLILQKQKRAEEAFFELVTPSFIARLKKIFKSIAPYALKAKKKEVNAYLKKQRKKIKTIVRNADFQKDQVHELRKLLKSYNYNRRLVEQKGTLRAIRSTDHLSDLVGKWHDIRTTLKYLEVTTKKHKILSTESRQLLAVTRKLDVESDQLFAAILKAIPHSEFITGN